MTATPPIVQENPSRHQFEIALGNGELAFAKYNLLPGAIRFYHTIVPENHRGQGLGTALVKASLAAARERGLTVIPVCPFFAAYLRKHPEEQDLVAPEHGHLIED